LSSGDDLSKQTSAKVRLKKGANPIVVRYAAPADGPAALRLYWAERTNPAEPIPPTVLTHDASDAELIGHLKLRAGRELFAKLRCAKCHTSDSAMPEAMADAPSLAGVGSRLRADWMARWIDDPGAVRHDASMPRVFPPADPRGADVAAYLATLKAGDPSDKDFAVTESARGARLFTGLGCIACHSFEDGKRNSLAGAKQKFFAGSLVSYLRDPQAHYAWNPMPDFQLSDDEARQLSAYIWSRAAGEPLPKNLRSASAARGKELFASSGCVNCHAVEEQERDGARTKIRVVRGCLAADDAGRGAAPDFALTEPQRAALAAVVEAGPSSVGHDTPADFADRQMRALNCVACHTLDAQLDTWSGLKDEIATIQSTAARDELAGDQSRPSLTWAGERLRTDWMARFIAGSIEEKPRPWLAARMPSFGETRGTLLAKGLALHHGILPGASDPEPPIDEELAAVGRRLVGKEKGFSCVTCHAVGAAPAISPFEAYGPNFTLTADRMRHDFYTRWVRNPQRYEPGTRMPQYADMDGKTSFRDVFEGDAAKQFEAIREYLRKRDKMEPPQ
jgi:mono/diheme cytochrome c family protein